MTKMKARIRAIVLAFGWIFRITVLDEVRYRSGRCTVIELSANNRWCAIRNKKKERYFISISHVTKLWSLRGVINSYKKGYDNYMEHRGRYA